MNVERIQHRSERDVVAAGVHQLDHLLFADQRDGLGICAIADAAFVCELMHEVVDDLLVLAREDGAVAVTQRIDHGIGNAFGARERGMRGPFVARAPMHRDHEDGELEEALVDLGAEPQRLADGRPVLAERGVVQEGVERPREIAVLIDERFALLGARSARDRMIELGLLGREVAAIDRGKPDHTDSMAKTNRGGI